MLPNLLIYTNQRSPFPSLPADRELILFANGLTYLSVFASFEGGQLKEIVDKTGHVLLYGTQSGVIKWPLLWSAQFLP